MNFLNTPIHTSTAVSAAPPSFTPSHYQQAIFDDLSQSRPGVNLLIEAVAGSGKTTTALHALSVLPNRENSIFLAFNKSIAEEIKAKGAPGSTFHALGMRGLRSILGNDFRIESGKVRKIMQSIVAKELRDDFAELPRLVSIGKNYGIGLFFPNVPQAWEDVLAVHELAFPDGGESKAIDFASRILEISNSDHTQIDFDDMLYLPLLLRAKWPTYEYVFVDEAQDTNGIQLEIIRQITTHNSRCIFIGDTHQAIYGFRGAGTDAMSRIAEAFSCEYLPLSVSYRCPSSVVDYAKRFVPQIESAPNASLGKVETMESWKPSYLTANSVVVCRNKKPLIRLAYALIKNGRQVQVLGKDIGAGFKQILKFTKAASMPELIKKLESARDKKADAEDAKKRFAKAESIRDQYDSLLCIIDAFPQCSVENVPREIDKLFADCPGAVQLCTVHKSKGLEWENVFILDANLYMPSKFALDSEGWQLEQEYNLIYVAATRAKKNLYFITSKGMN